MSAGQDYNRTIKPGGAERINGNGETYIFCKFADRPITIDIAGRKVVMQAGGYQEFEPLVGHNAAVTLFNEDPENPAYVTLVMGTGTYDEKIIRGEIVIDPRVKTADGRFVSDQRADHQIMVNLDYRREPAINQGEKTQEGNPSGDQTPEDIRPAKGGEINDEIVRFFYDGTNEYFITMDRFSGQVFDAVPVPGIAGTFDKTGCGTPYGNTWYCGANDRYVYVVLEGRTEELNSGDRYSNFQCEGNSWTRMFKGPNNELWGMDQDAKYYNIEKGYKAFDSGNAQNKGGFAIGNDFYTIDNNENVEKWVETSPQTWESQGVVYEVTGAIRDLGFAEYDAGAGLVRYFDHYGSSDQYPSGYFEPKSYDQGGVHYGRANEQCSRVPALINPALLSEIRTDAAVTVDWDNGRAWVSGEIIKAVLQMMGIDTSGNYLDGITGFRAVADGRVYNINLGGRTFAADKITDDFKRVLFPQVIEITALEALWSNRV